MLGKHRLVSLNYSRGAVGFAEVVRVVLPVIVWLTRAAQPRTSAAEARRPCLAKRQPLQQLAY
jgi:hypothetical protein